jgi:hypothetical protein
VTLVDGSVGPVLMDIFVCIFYTPAAQAGSHAADKKLVSVIHYSCIYVHMYVICDCFFPLQAKNRQYGGVALHAFQTWS